MTGQKSAYHHGDLREALIEAALATIADTGPKGLTIREVARRAGVSHAAPYRHFTDKDELILAAVERGFELLDRQMTEAREAAGPDPLKQFAASGEAYLDFAMEYPAYYRVMFSGDLLNSNGHEMLRHTSNPALEKMVEDIKNCQALGVVRAGDPLLHAIVIVSTVHGFATLVNDNRLVDLSGGSYEPKAIRDFVTGAIFEGLGVH